MKCIISSCTNTDQINKYHLCEAHKGAMCDFVFMMKLYMKFMRKLLLREKRKKCWK